MEKDKSLCVDICGPDNLFKVRKAGEDVTTAFRTYSMEKDKEEGHETGMWINKSNGGDKKHQYFGQFMGKEMKKKDGNTEE